MIEFMANKCRIHKLNNFKIIVFGLLDKKLQSVKVRQRDDVTRFLR